MGNEQSQIPGIEIDRKIIEVSDFWTQHSASISGADNVSRLTIFIGDLFINEPVWSPITPLERFSKNLMIYRHPCIIRYISSWQKTSKFHLAVEEVTPVSHLLSKMSTLEICLGLYSVLKALCFLHEKALVSHNNVCLASIFVNKEGSWKLGGMEYLRPYKELSADYLTKSRKHRYSKAIDSNEDKNLKCSSERKDFIDVYAFCVLVKELLKNRNDAEISNMSSFKDFCNKAIEIPDILQRPKLSSLLEHEFFKNSFISIHSYLIELPLKSDSDKTEFFTNLKDELEILNEEVVASQLGGLLVSRMVLLNKTAQGCLLPYILVPKREGNGGLFSEEIFRKYISPKLLKIFCVRDAQIRFLVLAYFPHFLSCFTKEELQLHILPELLVGIKDTNNDLVAATLRTLADLVLVLGAETVIGGKRAKLFNDGRPKSHSTSRKVSRTIRQEISEPEAVTASIDQLSITSSMVELIQNQNELPERPRPDGEEGETSTDEIEETIDEDVENWEDWDNENVETDPVAQVDNTENIVEQEVPPLEQSLIIQSEMTKTQTSYKKPKKILDITELDIKNQTKIVMEENEVDFFQDMEPVIEAKSKFVIDKKDDRDNLISSKLSVNVEEANEDGWGDDWE